MAESRKIVDAVAWVKREYNIKDDHAATKKLRELMFGTL